MAPFLDGATKGNKRDKYFYGFFVAQRKLATLFSGNRRLVAGARIYAMTQTIRRAPLSLPLSGYYDNSTGGAQNISSRGYFWTNKSISNEEARSNIFYSGYLRPQNNYWKGRGYAVRCVASS